MIRGERHRAAEQLAEAGRDRRERVLRVGLARRAAEVSADDHLGAAIEQGGQGRQRGPDPAVVRDTAAVERHVEVIAHQYPLAYDVEVIDCLHDEISFDPTRKSRLRKRVPDFSFPA